MRRYILMVIPAVLLWLFVTGCYTKLYRAGINGPPEGMYSETLYDRYDSSAIDTTLTKDDVFPDTYPSGYDYYDRWDRWGRYRPRTRWGFDFYNYSPPYYWGYYGWEDYYGYPWWHSHRGGYWGYGGGTVTPGEPPSKRPVGRRDEGRRGSPPSVEAPSRPPPATHVSTPPKSSPSRPPKPKKENKQRNFGRRKR